MFLQPARRSGSLVDLAELRGRKPFSPDDFEAISDRYDRWVNQLQWHSTSVSEDEYNFLDLGPEKQQPQTPTPLTNNVSQPF
jgi:hypothetical protein